MDINKRIEKIKEYFSQFNVYYGLNVLIIKLPKKWSDFDYREMCYSQNITVEKSQNNELVFTNDMNDGCDKLFDMVEEIIKFNEQIEKKTQLFKEKTEELKALFSTESYEKLQTLFFSFGNNKKNNKSKTKKKELVVVNEVSNPDVTINDSVEVEKKESRIEIETIPPKSSISLVDYVTEEILEENK